MDTPNLEEIKRLLDEAAEAESIEPEAIYVLTSYLSNRMLKIDKKQVDRLKPLESNKCRFGNDGCPPSGELTCACRAHFAKKI